MMLLDRITGKIVVYNPMNHELTVMSSTDTFSGSIAQGKYVCYVIAPITKIEIAF